MGLLEYEIQIPKTNLGKIVLKQITEMIQEVRLKKKVKEAVVVHLVKGNRTCKISFMLIGELVIDGIHSYTFQIILSFSQVSKKRRF